MAAEDFTLPQFRACRARTQLLQLVLHFGTGVSGSFHQSLVQTFERFWIAVSDFFTETSA